MFKTLNYVLLELKLGQFGETILPSAKEGNDTRAIKIQFVSILWDDMSIGQLDYLQICKSCHHKWLLYTCNSSNPHQGLGMSPWITRPKARFTSSLPLERISLPQFIILKERANSYDDCFSRKWLMRVMTTLWPHYSAWHPLLMTIASSPSCVARGEGSNSWRGNRWWICPSLFVFTQKKLSSVAAY